MIDVVSDVWVTEPYVEETGHVVRVVYVVISMVVPEG